MVTNISVKEVIVYLLALILATLYVVDVFGLMSIGELLPESVPSDPVLIIFVATIVLMIGAVLTYRRVQDQLDLP